MAGIVKRRVAADIEGDFVVFLIGMRINKLWKFWKWLPVFTAMPKMLTELQKDPDSGFLGADQYFGSPRRPMIVQYWRSFDHLERYSRDPDAKHWPAWVAFNKKVASNGDVGIWHETYLVSAGSYEAIYNNMPPHGLGKYAGIVPASGRRTTAAGRAGLSDETSTEPVPEEATA